MIDSANDRRYLPDIVPLIPTAWRRLDYYLNQYINSQNMTQQAKWGPVTFKSGQIMLPNR